MYPYATDDKNAPVYAAMFIEQVLEEAELAPVTVRPRTTEQAR